MSTHISSWHARGICQSWSPQETTLLWLILSQYPGIDGPEGTHLLVLECVQSGVKFLLLDAQIIHLVKLLGVFFRLHHQLPAHLGDLFLPGKEGGTRAK